MSWFMAFHGLTDKNTGLKLWCFWSAGCGLLEYWLGRTCKAVGSEWCERTQCRYQKEKGCTLVFLVCLAACCATAYDNHSIVLSKRVGLILQCSSTIPCRKCWMLKRHECHWGMDTCMSAITKLGRYRFILFTIYRRQYIAIFDIIVIN